MFEVTELYPSFKSSMLDSAISTDVKKDVEKILINLGCSPYTISDNYEGCEILYPLNPVCYSENEEIVGFCSTHNCVLMITMFYDYSQSVEIIICFYIMEPLKIEEDNFTEMVRKSTSRTRHHNDVYKDKHKRSIAKNRSYYRCGMFVDEETDRLYDIGNKRTNKELRKLCNRKLRRNKMKELPRKGNSYRKMYEYQWEVI